MGTRIPLAQRIGWRQSVWLTLGLWAFTYLTFLMPSFADHGGMAWYGYSIIAAAVLPGLLLSMPLYLLLWTTRSWPVAPRIALVAMVAAMAAWCHSMLDASIVLALRTLLALGTVAPVTLARLVDKFLSYVWIYELYAAAIGLILSAALVQDRERRLSAAQLAARGAELATLRHQLNPHFLFNTLNAISGLIVTGRAARAEEMLGRLSGYLRASLDGDGAEQAVELDREIETVAAYLDIEGARFGDRLRFEVDCPADLADALVPGFILQPLVENAVKHGVGGSSAPVTIRLAAAADGARLNLAVIDDGAARCQAAPGAGLDALRNRLNILYGRDAALEAGPSPLGYAAAIVLPLRRATGAGAQGARKGA